ncbi:RlpA-like double-psi beta-barrel-protein domain-containing protein-containing protein [Cokeromyces recurvatus]|uniref:RlpA-like double-psi beta-barrel-protein domain-containing protein-containing protein n=1 Tax=Cokeromyces recurvatus TaxID=90255 RepID=UPI00221EB69F|nr:RlpA-like double-psi beta-barrel-protein domain-containing protein-containing protein [Cokeromyces recurvatus]KAI7904284.1 RlpA-like double-psi beta-barrel-protein domain-containing protein-containing protein [Cokeromyces recurvatus]
MQTRLIPVFIALIALLITLVTAAPVDTLEKRKSGKVYEGTATWYKPETEGGTKGACNGKKISSKDYIVALNHKQYGNMDKNSAWCGKKISITGPRGTTTATIQDACPGCGYGDLDLTPAVFEEVAGGLKKGVAKISWKLA